MFTTIIKSLAVSATLAATVSQASAQDIKTACEVIGGGAQELAEMRDIGMDMVDAMNLFITLNGVTEAESLEWVYTLATIAYENPEELPHDVGFIVFLSCMDAAGGVNG
jgi:hypothetical protein